MPISKSEAKNGGFLGCHFHPLKRVVRTVNASVTLFCVDSEVDRIENDGQQSLCRPLL